MGVRSRASLTPDVGASWRSVWEYATDFDFRLELVNGITFGGSTVPVAFWNFVTNPRNGWTPTNPAYRTTFPSDPSSFHNMGAAPMVYLIPFGIFEALGALGS